MNRQAVIKSIEENKIIVILRGLDREALIKSVAAMNEGGIRLFEVTFNASGVPADEEVGKSIRILADTYRGRCHIGAGTVLTPRQAEIAAAAGAEYIISPDTNPDVIGKTRELGLVSIPGAMTPSEATLAHRSGADFVKLFPNGAFSPSYLRAVAVPLSHIRFLAVGGVNEYNVAEYLAAGAVGIGVSAGIVNKQMIAAGDWAGLSQLAKAYTSAIAAASAGH